MSALTQNRGVVTLPPVSRRMEVTWSAPASMKGSLPATWTARPERDQESTPSNPPSGARKYSMVSPKRAKACVVAGSGQAADATPGRTASAAVVARLRP